MTELTQRQRAILDFVWGAIRRTGISPSMREIADGCGINSINGASDHLDALAKKGFIQRGPRGHSRSLRVLKYFDDEGRVISILQNGQSTQVVPAVLTELADLVRAWQACDCEYINCEHARAIFYFKLSGLPRPPLSELLDQRAELAKLEAQLARTGTNERSLTLSEGREGAYRGAAELARSYEAGGLR